MMREWPLALEVLRRCGALDRRMKTLLAAYVVLTPLSAAADALSWFLLALLVVGSGAAALGPDVGMMGRAAMSLGLDGDRLLWAAAACFLARAVLAVAVAYIDGKAYALLRRSLQERLLARVLDARWSDLRSGQVGLWVGALTEECMGLAKYVMSFARSAYYGVSAAVLGLMALATDARKTLVMVAVGAPAWLLLKGLYRRQSELSADNARDRLGFAADITERLTGLFQIKAAGEEAVQARLGARRQQSYTEGEIAIGLYSGLLSVFNLLMVPLMLGVFAWLAGGAESLRQQMATLGGVALLGYRTMAQLSQFVGSVGGLTRLAGCVEPLHRLSSLPPEPERAPLPSALKAVLFERVAVRAGARRVLDGLDLRAGAGRLLLVAGPSGAGKTTLANLAAGLLPPDEGRVLYEDASGARHDARAFRARIGYVAQDVHLMRGTVRENLDPAGARTDADLQEALRRAGAASFVAGRGGLDAEVSEAGRSFSGGEKRRLAIAHALAARADALILDEVTNGLDEETKRGLVATISELAKEAVIVAITHDLAAFSGIDADRLDLGASR